MRSFVALELPAAVRAALERRVTAARPGLPPARWVKTAGIHLTLVFLGEIEPSQATALAARLAGVFRRHPALALQLDGGGTFPPGRPARVVWVGMTPAPGLTALQAEVGEACRRELGLTPERRPFRPHLTVARCRRPWPVGAARRWRRALEGPTGAAFTVTEGVLMESRLLPQGAAYRPVARLPLAGGEEGAGR